MDEFYRSLRHKFKLIVTDMDDSLIKSAGKIHSVEADRKLSPLSRVLISLLRKKMVGFAVITGARLESALYRYANELSPEDRAGQYVYVCGGGEGYRFNRQGSLDERSRILYMPISEDRDEVDRLVVLMEESVKIILGGYGLDAGDFLPVDCKPLNGMPVELTVSRKFNEVEDKIREEVVNEIRRRISDCPEFKGIKAFRSSMAVEASRADKADALRNLIHFTGIRPEDILIIGDSENDLPMFRAVAKAVKLFVGNKLRFNLPKEVILSPVAGPAGEQEALKLVLEAYGVLVSSAVSENVSRELNTIELINALKNIAGNNLLGDKRDSGISTTGEAGSPLGKNQYISYLRDSEMPLRNVSGLAASNNFEAMDIKALSLVIKTMFSLVRAADRRIASKGERANLSWRLFALRRFVSSGTIISNNSNIFVISSFILFSAKPFLRLNTNLTSSMLMRVENPFILPASMAFIILYGASHRCFSDDVSSLVSQFIITSLSKRQIEGQGRIKLFDFSIERASQVFDKFGRSLSFGKNAFIFSQQFIGDIRFYFMRFGNIEAFYGLKNFFDSGRHNKSSFSHLSIINLFVDVKGKHKSHSLFVACLSARQDEAGGPLGGGEKRLLSLFFTASPISSIIFKAWQRLAEIGDLDTIRTMDALGLANVLGAKKVEKEKDLKFARAFIVSVDTWENIIKMRQNPEIQKNWIICFVSIN